MVLHVVIAAALLMEQSKPPTVLVQCASNVAQDPLWARLVLAGLPSVFAILISWLVFRLNRGWERERWILEQKKTEWKELLTFASEVERFTPSVGEGRELIVTVHDPLFREHLRDMTRAVLKCTFIPEKSRGTIYESILKVQLTNEEAKGHIEDHTSNAHLAAELGKPRPLGAAQAVQSELVSLWREVRRFAAEDLDVEHQKRWWRDIGNWFKSFHWPQAKNKTLTG